MLYDVSKLIVETACSAFCLTDSLGGGILEEMKKGYGFTIVELLIVIVVVAILAAISMVTYKGITDRVHDTVVKNDLQKVVRLLDIYSIDHGQWPSRTTGDDGFIASMVAGGFRMNGRSSYAVYPQTISNFTVCLHLDGEAIAVATMSKSGRAFFVYSRDGFTQREMTLAQWASSDATARCQFIGSDLSSLYPNGTYGNYNGYNSDDTTTGPWRSWTSG